MSDRLEAALEKLQATQAKALVIKISANATPLEFLQAVYLNEAVSLPTRMKAAIEAAPYVHPKFALVATVPASGDFSAMLDRAIAASQAGREPKLIETKPKTNGRTAQEVSTERMSESFASLRKRF